jgi:hypothetical protein
VTPDVVNPLDRPTLEGCGWAAGSLLDLWFHTDPVRLGTIETDGFGEFQIAPQVPGTASSGMHAFEVVGRDSYGYVVSQTVPVEVTGAPAAVASSEGSGDTSDAGSDWYDRLMDGIGSG